MVEWAPDGRFNVENPIINLPFADGLYKPTYIVDGVYNPFISIYADSGDGWLLILGFTT